MSYRTTVTMTDEMAARIRAYAHEHGATTGAAIVALAARKLREIEDETATNSMGGKR